MGIGASFSIFDVNGNPKELPIGTYFCLNCHTLRKKLYFSGTITEYCKKCGSQMVYKPD